MRVDVKKYVFFGLNKHLDQFLAECQTESVVEFIDLKAIKTSQYYNQYDVTFHALYILKKYIRNNNLDIEHKTRHINKEWLREVIDIRERIDALEEKNKEYSALLSEITPWGSFSKEDIRLSQSQLVQFFYGSSRINTNNSFIHVNTIEGTSYYFTVSEKLVEHDELKELRPQYTTVELERMISEINIKIRDLNKRLKKCCEYVLSVQNYLVDVKNDLNRDQVVESVNIEDNRPYFYIKAWIPKNRYRKIERIANSNTVFIQELPIEKDDKVPTHLVNKGYSKVGEDLISVYDTPSTRDKDPSLWVLWSFAFFFAMIIGDAIYGCIFLIAALYMKYSLNPRGTLRRINKLVLILSMSCILWGTLTQSYFGIKLSPDSFTARFSVVDNLASAKWNYHLSAKDSTYETWVKKYPGLEGKQSIDAFQLAVKRDENNVIMDYTLYDHHFDIIMREIALVVGLIHIILSMLRSVKTNYAQVGWVVTMLGGWMYFPTFLDSQTFLNYIFGLSPETCAVLGLQLLQVGAALVSVLAVYQNGIFGILELINGIQLFSDVLSYIRLYALGLSGALMSQTFNTMASGTTWYFALLILIVGHSINVVLGIVAGVLHGLRLNFMEWYRYSFEGGGFPLKPLKLIKK
jgi:V/A-type H+/Na+-transporting ATPase subunit I